jgi:glucans biosynthesis protein
VRPARDARTLTIYALLDSPRASGAYRFVLQPGVTTAVDVKARLHMRENVTRLGMAPLTSMFFFGDNQRSQLEDYRQQVHDSEGLLVHSGTGEWIWRPLVNPRRLLVTSFALTNPRGFGLMQRDRTFRSYEDLEARYELRPSAWIEPRGNWGAGHVELVQIPTPDETNDNIVAYWVPDQPPQARQSYDFEYRQLWQKNEQTRPPLSWVTQTRRGHGYVRKRDDTTMFVIDFAGPALAKLGPNEPVEAVVTVDENGKLVESNAYRNEAAGGWRTMVRVAHVNARRPVELRAYLKLGKDTLSETWSYILPPK